MEDYDEARSITLTEARRMVRGKGGGDCSLDVLRRYASPKRGCRPLGEGGPVIYLRVVKVGGRLRTMPEWVEAFVRERAALTDRRPPVQARSPRAARAGHKRAGERLDRAGVK